MQVRPATLFIVASVAALFGFAGAASRCAPVDDVAAARAPLAAQQRAHVAQRENVLPALLQR